MSRGADTPEFRALFGIVSGLPDPVQLDLIVNMLVHLGPGTVERALPATPEGAAAELVRQLRKHLTEAARTAVRAHVAFCGNPECEIGRRPEDR